MYNILLKSKFYPLVFQILSLFVFILLVIGGLGITTESSVIAKQLRNTNLSNLIVWSYWWPLIVLTAVFFGRHWCTICPIELLSAIAVKLGLKTKTPRLIKTGWLITILYAFIAIFAIHTWGIHRIPNLMALYLLSLMGLAIVVSLVFEKRAFCSYFCPVGKLLGLYSLISSIGLRVKSKDICKNCNTKDCVQRDNQFKIIGRSCTSSLYPANITDNKDCILCSQCVKSCPNDNIELQKKANSFLSFDFNKFSWAEVGMVIILLGFVSYEILSSWKFSKSVLLSLPNKLFDTLSFSFISIKSFEAIIIFVVLPLIFIMLFSGFAKLTGKGSFSFYIKRTVGYLLPIIALGHVFKALMKTTSRIPYWQYALDKPNGTHFAEKIVNKQITINNIEWLNLIVILLGILGLIFALYYTIKKIRLDEELSLTNRIIYFTVTLIYFSVLVFGPVSNFV